MQNENFLEKDYRELLQKIFDEIEASFASIDPDLAECEQALGAMTIKFKDGSRCILSAQPSVRQLWVALAAKGVAYHFDYNFEKKTWWDDKGRGLEFKALLKTHLKEMTEIEFEF